MGMRKRPLEDFISDQWLEFKIQSSKFNHWSLVTV